MKSVDDLWNRIGYVVLCAPDRFPYRDYLPADGQMTLDRAFDELRAGIEVAYPETEFADKRVALNAVLDRSIAAYRAGDRRGGAHILQDDFQDSIFKKT